MVPLSPAAHHSFIGGQHCTIGDGERPAITPALGRPRCTRRGWPCPARRGPYAGGAESSENTDISSVARSTTSTFWLGSTVQPGCGHPELAATTTSAVIRQA